MASSQECACKFQRDTKVHERDTLLSPPTHHSSCLLSPSLALRAVLATSKFPVTPRMFSNRSVADLSHLLKRRGGGEGGGRAGARHACVVGVSVSGPISHPVARLTL